LKSSAFGLRLVYFEDWTPRGAAGCVRDAGMKTDADTFVVADGTTVPVLELAELLERHHASRAAVTVVVAADAHGRLRPCGVYVFDRRAFDHIPEDGYQDIKEKLIPSLYRANEQVATHMALGAPPRVVNADTYLTLDQWVVERTSRRREAPDGFRSSGETVLHESAFVDPTARLLGPVLLGPGVSVHAGATLVGPVSIGAGTIVGEDAVVSRSVVWSGCVVGERAFVDRSMLADSAVVEPGVAVISAMRTDARRPVTPGSPTRGQERAPWAPIVAALRPTTPSNS
jgi:NDP-sugar pyrophosphorylase family protein